MDTDCICLLAIITYADFIASMNCYRLPINHKVLQHYYYFVWTYFFGEEGTNVEKAKNNAQFDERKVLVLSKNVSYNMDTEDLPSALRM